MTSRGFASHLRGARARQRAWCMSADYGRLAPRLLMPILAAGFLSGAPQTAQAQDATTVVTRQARCPDKMLSHKPGEQMLVLVPDLKVFRTEKGDEATNITLRLREALSGPYNVDSRVRKTAKVDRYLVRLDRDGQSYCGWVLAGHEVLVGRDPMRVSDIDSTDSRETRSGQIMRNPLNLKVMLRSNPEIVPKGAREWDARNVPIFSSPDDSAPYRTYSIFSIFHAYQVRKDAKGEAAWYYIAGQNPYNASDVAGWVKSDSAFVWDNRVSLYFSSDQRAGDGVIYGTDVGAKTNDQSDILAKRTKAMLEPPKRNIARFPILDHVKAGDATVYQLAVFGDACIDGGPCVSGTQMVDDQGQRGTEVGQLKNVDILFVVDNTKSMRDYIKASIGGANQGAEAILREFGSNEGNERGQVRFAGALYGDYKSRQAVTLDNLDFKLFNFRPNLKSIEEMGAYRQFLADAIGDYPEAAFAGLIRAIKDAEWSPHSGVRMVFWIGDHGNRAVGVNEVFGVEDVRAALRDAKVTFFVPINVAGDYVEKFNELFITQAREISKFSAGAGGNFQVTTTYDKKTYDKNKITSEDTAVRIKDILRLTYSAAIGAREQLREAAPEAPRGSGTAPPMPAVSPRPQLETTIPVAELTQGDLVERILRVQGLSQDAIQRFRKAKQLMTYGHVKLSRTSREFVHWVALEKENMQLLNSFMDNTCKILNNQDVGPQLRRLLVRLVETFGGDDFRSEESVYDFLARQLFLPKESFSSVLDKTFEELVDWWRSNSTKEAGHQFRRAICRSAYLFNNVDSNQRIDPDEIEPEDQLGFSWRPKPSATVREFVWGYKLVNDITYFFVPVSYFPSDPDTQEPAPPSRRPARR